MTLWEYLDRRAVRRAKLPASVRLSFRDYLAMFLLVAFVASVFYLLRTAFPKQNEQLITYMLGQLSGFAGTAIALYYTLSKHDEQRAEDTANVVEAARDVANAARAQAGPTGNAGDPVHTVEESK